MVWILFVRFLYGGAPRIVAEEVVIWRQFVDFLSSNNGAQGCNDHIRQLTMLDRPAQVSDRLWVYLKPDRFMSIEFTLKRNAKWPTPGNFNPIALYVNLAFPYAFSKSFQTALLLCFSCMSLAGLLFMKSNCGLESYFLGVWCTFVFLTYYLISLFNVNNNGEK